MLKAEGREVGRRHASTLMKKMGVEAIYRRPNTSKPAPGPQDLPLPAPQPAVERGRTRCGRADITYVPIARGYVYLAAIVDWFSRCVLSWRFSNSWRWISVSRRWRRRSPGWRAGDLEHRSGVAAHARRLHHGVTTAEIAIGMDGKGRARQRHRRAVLANGEIRKCLPPSLRRRRASPRFDRPVSELSQRQEAAFVAWRKHSRPSIHQLGDANPGGSLKWAAEPLKNAPKAVQTNRATSLAPGSGPADKCRRSSRGW